MRDPYAVAVRRTAWRALAPSPDERRLTLAAFDLGRRHGLRFAAGEVEVYFSGELATRGLNGQADWKGVPVIVWIQIGLSPRELTRVVLHELAHAHGALREADYDDWSYEEKEAHAHRISRGILAAECWSVLT